MTKQWARLGGSFVCQLTVEEANRWSMFALGSDANRVLEVAKGRRKACEYGRTTSPTSDVVREEAAARLALHEVAATWYADLRKKTDACTLQPSPERLKEARQRIAVIMEKAEEEAMLYTRTMLDCVDAITDYASLVSDCTDALNDLHIAAKDAAKGGA